MRRHPPGPQVRLERIVAGYRRGLTRLPVLREASWEARPGEVTALVGPNGAGKTTTFRVLLGVLSPWAGTATVGPGSPAAWRVGHGTAFLPEERIRLPGWTVGSLAAAGRTAAIPPGGPGPHAAPGELEALGLADLAGARVDALSRGQVRTALLAWALAGEPRLVLLDEPWSGLDPGARDRLREALDRLRARGATVVVSSHELLEVARVADRIVVLAGGGVAATVSREGLDAEALERRMREATR